MPLKHADIWRAIDRLAEQEGLSPSGLARKAGLSPTVFNPSKRASAKRKHWPSTESIAQILQATGTGLDHFVALATPDAAMARVTLPLLNYEETKREGSFDDNGHPAVKGWEEVQFPALSDPHAFAVEVVGKNMEPVYRDGTRIFVSPAAAPRRGDRVIVRTSKGEMIIGQLGRDNAQKIDIIALGPGADTHSLSRRDIDWVYRILWASQ